LPPGPLAIFRWDDYISLVRASGPRQINRAQQLQPAASSQQPAAAARRLFSRGCRRAPPLWRRGASARLRCASARSRRPLSFFSPRLIWGRFSPKTIFPKTIFPKTIFTKTLFTKTIFPRTIFPRTIFTKII
jgi:hypothetical protein